jgi:hypothetical protein
MCWILFTCYIYLQFNLLLSIYSNAYQSLFWVSIFQLVAFILYAVLHSFHSQPSHLVCAVHASEASSRSECQSSVSSYLLKTIQEHTHLIGLKIQQNFTEYFCFDMNKAGANFLLQVRGCSLLVMILLFTLIYCFPFGITVIDCVTCGWPYCFLYIVWRFSVSVPPIFLSSSL